MPLQTLPEWIGSALLTASIAALGFVAKQLFDAWTAHRLARSQRRARLAKLASLLNASKSLFLTQRIHNGALADAIHATRTDATVVTGFDKLFAEAYPNLTGDPLDLHRLIRGMTEHGMRPINTALSTWLNDDVDFRVPASDDARLRDLAAALNQLDSHLLLWHAKYESWIPGHPEHALVYLGDEQKHGVPFPSKLDELVAVTLRDGL